ncbi:2514_t:CDS:1 [Acaulospora morrowiae]|uniref:2514_t:CDS:1 n=1 Tax=Acaulospora morrowiae TaxID=94023 RepID=A0A9N9DXJ7_9GLOM|nr:2514_t:CDS:1 [Acaulospora morrowiae]
MQNQQVSLHISSSSRFHSPDKYELYTHRSSIPIRYALSPYQQPDTITPKTQYITTEFIDDVINSVITSDERKKYESKLYLPLHDLIFPSNRLRRTTTRCQNSFIIFRKDYQARVIAEHGPKIGSKLQEISRKASQIWGKCSPEDRYMYDQIALCTKKLHGKLWSNCDVRRATRRQGVNYGNYGYGEITEGCSATFFTQDSNEIPSYHDDPHLSKSKFVGQNSSRTRLEINSLSSYDKALVESINKSVRI